MTFPYACNAVGNGYAYVTDSNIRYFKRVQSLFDYHMRYHPGVILDVNIQSFIPSQAGSPEAQPSIQQNQN